MISGQLYYKEGSIPINVIINCIRRIFLIQSFASIVLSLADAGEFTHY
jgi:hypothetical protein